MRFASDVSYAIIALSLLLLCGGCGHRAGQAPPAPTVQIVHPKKGAIGRTITLPGNVLAYQQATLYAKAAGYLKTITVDKGDRVKEGDFLADIEVPELIADRAKFAADVAVAEIDYRRQAEAHKKAPELVVAQAVDNAKGKYDVAHAELERTDTLLGYGRITAPFSGVIIKRMVDPGAFIPAATSGSPAQTAAIVTLADLSTVRVQTDVPEAEAAFVKDGLPVSVTVEELPGRKFDATITRYSHALDERSKTILIESEIANPAEELLPGMYAHVTIEIERHEHALLIPVEALVAEKNADSVFALTPDKKAKKVRVKVGFNDGQSVEILEGLKPEQPVIVAGTQALNDGQPVSAVEKK